MLQKAIEDRIKSPPLQSQIVELVSFDRLPPTPPVPVKDPDPEVPTITVSDTPPVPVKDPDPEVPPKFLYQEPPGTANSWMMENDKNDKTLKQHFKDFTDNTSLHGLQYVGEDGRNWFERYYFLSICLNPFCTLRSKSLPEPHCMK